MTEGNSPQVCPHCGNLLPAGATQCPRCDSRWDLLLRSRETVLSIAAAILIVLFFLTGFIARGYHRKLAALGGQWFAKGEQSLRDGEAAAALADFHTALVYRPDDAQIQFRLAQALAAAGRNSEARAYLLGLLPHSASDAPVNLALARISAEAGSEPDALRYYHGAIYGVWPKDAQTNRLNARLELCQFLVAQNDAPIAEAELIAFVAEIPEEHGAPLHAQAGELFLRIGNASRALSEFRKALAAEHPPVGSLRGAGLAAYQLGDYRQAERYLDRAHRLHKDDTEVSNALEISRFIISADPYSRGLSEVERRERAQRAFEQALSRFGSCAKSRGANLSAGATMQSDFAKLYRQARALQPQLTERNLSRHPGRMDAAMNLAFAMEDFATQQCGAPQDIDAALSLIGKARQGSER